MPKKIDHEQRRAAIADALFEALREGGIDRVTLSSVAARAGLAIGSVRHFLGTREQMIGFAFETIADRIHARVVARADAVLSALEDEALDGDDALEATADILCEFLPLDATRRDEVTVWIEFEAAARTEPHLAETSRRAAAQTAQLVETILAAAARRGTLDASIDLATETARLAALVDGLALRGALHRELLSPEVARLVVIVHLRELRRSAFPRASGAGATDGASVSGVASCPVDTPR